MLKIQRSSALGFRYGFGGMSLSSLPYNISAPLHNTLIARARYHSNNSSPNNGPKRLLEALSSFDRMVRMRPLPCVVEFNQLLGQITKMKHYSDVISLYKQMCLLRIMPNDYTLNILINCFCHLNHVSFGLSVFGKFVKFGYKPDTVTMTTLLKGFFREGKIAEAEEFYHKMTQSGCEPDVITYNTLLNGLCKRGNTSAAVWYLRKMGKDKHCKPDTFCYTTVIDGLCKAGLFVDALSLFSEMDRKGIVPDVVTYTTLIHGAYMLDEWKEVIMRLKKWKLEKSLLMYRLTISWLMRFAKTVGLKKHKA